MKAEKKDEDTGERSLKEKKKKNEKEKEKEIQ